MQQHSAKVVADSINTKGNRLTSLEVVFPRIVLAECNTHRMLAKNSASSRAIPVQKMLKRVIEDPYIPSEWGMNQRGMQAGAPLDARDAEKATHHWLRARDLAVEQAEKLLDQGVHKQLTNRLLEPFMWHTALLTGTDWSNFVNLRCNPAAHPDFRLAAEAVFQALRASKPRELSSVEWHLPYIRDEDYEECILADAANPIRALEKLKRVSVGRCARLSYQTQDGVRDLSKDVELHDKLLSDGHMSPTEPVARPMSPLEHHIFGRWWTRIEGYDLDLPLSGGMPEVGKTVAVNASGKLLTGRVISTEYHAYSGSYDGWVPYRKTLAGEGDILGHRGQGVVGYRELG